MVLSRAHLVLLISDVFCRSQTTICTKWLPVVHFMSTWRATLLMEN
ncbi:hypothetical protein M758_UG006500 [Ceratodon purpureus]|nr:hypothetical protein M758_UG006500 [Ceratodon purpureus]